MELRFNERLLLLTAAETDELRTHLPPGWNNPVFQMLECGEDLGDPSNAYEFFDVFVRDAVAENWFRSEESDEPPRFELIERVLDRIVEAYPNVAEDVFGREGARRP